MEQGESPPYIPPNWSTPPKFNFNLEVIKGGVELARIDISKKPFYLVGRNDACDIVLQHESISRHHAAVQFGEMGELYIIDLGSTHGTKINKQQIKPRVYDIVPVGSVIQFGESTRLYVVNGPPELMPPEAAVAPDERAKPSAFGIVSTGVTWGDKEDAVDEDAAFGAGIEFDEEGRLKRQTAVTSSESSWIYDLDSGLLNEREMVIYDRLRKRHLRAKNLREEISRIAAKEATQDSGLTEGQLAQIAKDESALEALQPQLEEDEDLLLDRLRARGIPIKGISSGDSKAHPEDREPDYYPDAEEDGAGDDLHYAPIQRMGKTAQLVLKTGRGAVTTSVGVCRSSKPTAGAKQLQPEVQTYETLEKKLSAVKSEMSALQARDDATAELPVISGQSEDDLDAFMAQTTERMRSEDAANRVKRLTELETERNRLETLVSIAKPAIDSFLPKAVNQGEKPELMSSKAVNTATSASILTAAKLSRTIGAATTMTSLRRISATVSSEDDHNGLSEQAITKKPRIIGPAAPPPSTRPQYDSDDIDAKWIPPTGQTGDGRTALNQKYGY